MSLTFSLDLHTAYLMAGLMCLLSGMATFAMRNLYAPSRFAVAVFAVGMMLAGGSMMLANLAHGWMPGSTLRMINVMINAVAVVLVLEGVRQLYGHSSRLILSLMTVGFVCVIYAASPSRQFTTQVHLLFQAGCSISACAYIVMGKDSVSRMHRWLLAATFAVLALAGISRLLIATLSPDVLVSGPDARIAGINAAAMLFYVILPPMQATLIQAIASHRQVAMLSHHAATDELTGAASRRFLFSRAQSWLVRREGIYPSTALLMIDIDHFKSVNDRYGHVVGDRVLRHVADILQRTLRYDSLLARYGGEEFCALVPVVDGEEARGLADRLRRAVEAEAYVEDEVTIRLTISIGLALHRVGLTLHDVLRAADRRVYEAKTQGRNRVVSDEPTLESAIV